MKIYTKIFPLAMREKIISEGYEERGISRDFILSDGHNVKDILRIYKQVAEEDPDTMNEIKEAISGIFKEDIIYYLNVGRRMLWGMEWHTVNSLYQIDVTDTFLETCEQLIKEGETDLNEFESAFNENVKQNENYKESVEKLQIMNFDFSGFDDIYK